VAEAVGLAGEPGWLLLAGPCEVVPPAWRLGTDPHPAVTISSRAEATPAAARCRLVGIGAISCRWVRRGAGSGPACGKVTR
jgi:hypothetical protein